MTDTQPETPLIGSNAPDARARLLAHFNHDYEKHPTLWDDLYKQDFIPWDKGFSNPALADTLSDRTDILGSPMHSLGRRKRALVPGCGKGYDVLLLASFGYDAFGLEVSERALEACKETVQKASDTRPTNSEHGKGSFNFVSGDFFKDGWVEKAGAANDGFDLIYDYTFLSALPPTTRPAWSERMADLLSKDGRFICVEFPTYKEPHTGGPPWALPPSVYLAHLSQPGQEIQYNAEGYPAENAGQPPSDKGLKRLAHWQPERTHEIGKGTDWVSIWSH